MATTTEKRAEEQQGNMREVDERLGLIAEQLAVQGEQIRAILKILTAEKEGDGPSLVVLLGELILRLDGQTRYLKEVAIAVRTLGQELPNELVAAIGNNLSGRLGDGTGEGHDGSSRG
jgi:hypothetical protein